MPAGLEVRNANDSQILLIDATYANLTLLGRAVVTMTDYGSSSGSCVMGYFDANQRIPMLAFNGSAYAFSRSQPIGTNLWRHFLYMSAPLGAQIECFLFEDSNQVARANYGLEVFDGNGRVVFTSNGKYMKVIGRIAGTRADLDNAWNNPGGGLGFSNRTFSFPGVQKPLLVESILPVYATIGAGGVPNTFSIMTFVMFGSTGPGTVSLSYGVQAVFDNQTNPQGPAEQPDYLWLVLDGASLV